MFNPKKFESAVYAFVTDKVNKAVSTVSKDKEKARTEGIRFHRQIMEALHEITEETATQILYGLLLAEENTRPRKGKSKLNRSPLK